MCAKLTSSRYLDSRVSDWALKSDTELFSSLRFNLTNLLTTISILFEKCDGSLKAEFWTLNSICLDEINYVMRLNDLDKKNRANLTWVVKVPFMIPLFLENLNPVLSSLYQSCDVEDFIFTLLLIVRWVRNAELL